MEKDLDERIVPQGQYREALNIGVATSEDSDVGAAQNILGNIRVTSAISSLTLSGGEFQNEHVNPGEGKIGWNFHIAEIVDPQTDMLYRFVHTPNEDEGIWMDRIVEYNTSKSLDIPWYQKEKAVMVDIFKVTSKIVNHDCICPGSNKSKIMVDRNLNQLRWGMKVEGIEMDDNITIEHIDYNTGWITLSAAIWSGNTPNQIPPVVGPCNQCQFCNTEITFYGDRNLNFAPERKITGINIIDGMIFWTDNYSEPKKLNIERCKAGSTNDSIGRGTNAIDNFNQHTLLMVTIDNDLQNVESCAKDESFCHPVGCMDDGNQPWSLYQNPPTPAINFDPFAIFHDQDMCCYFSGCTDGSLKEDGSGEYLYCNYDPNACFDNGSCCDTCGCTDSSACNYDPGACHDDGSCIYGGCMESKAINYDPNAACHDESQCEYKWSCVDSGYENSDCSSSLTRNQALTMPQNYTINTNSSGQFQLEYILPDALENSTWINANNKAIIMGDSSDPWNESVWTATDNGNIKGVPMTAWMYGENGYTQMPIGSLSWRQQSTGTWQCTGSSPSCDDGDCNYPVNPNDYSQGYYTDHSTKYIVVEKVWAQIDGKSYKTWNETGKVGYIGNDPANGHPDTGYWGSYTDGAGVFWEPTDMFTGRVCFGDCPSSFNGAPLIQGGSTYEDMVNWFRENGYDGTGPSIAAQYGGYTCCNLPTGDETAKLDASYMGLGAYIGTISGSDFINHHQSGGSTTPVPNGPNTANTTQPMNLMVPKLMNWDYPTLNTSTPKYIYGQFPEVTINDTLPVLWSKISNNGIGWTYIGMGDIPIVGHWYFAEQPCGCTNWNSEPTCVKDPNGPHIDEGDCFTCPSCACNPQNKSWNCVNGQCVEIAGLSGDYPSLAICSTTCSPGSGI